MKNVNGDEVRVPKFSGAQLRKCREDLCLTQRQMAELTGIAVNALQRYEYGEVVPGADVLMLISTALDVGMSYFFE